MTDMVINSMRCTLYHVLCISHYWGNPYFVVKKNLAPLDKRIKIRMRLQELFSPFVHEFIASLVPMEIVVNTSPSKYYDDVFVYLSKVISGVETGLN